jgi:hypothetical protein
MDRRCEEIAFAQSPHVAFCMRRALLLAPRRHASRSGVAGFGAPSLRLLPQIQKRARSGAFTVAGAA